MTIKKPNARMICAAIALIAPAIVGAGPVEFEFDASDFSSPTHVTNDYWGLRLGGPDRAVYFWESDDGCEVSESIVTGVTDPGFFADPYDIQAIVIHDREWVSEECDGTYVLVEDTDDWYAQDDHGHVWYVGEATTAWDDENDCLTDAGSWKAGEDGATPGVIMLSNPRPGVSYQQEYYEGEAEDLARVLRLNAPVSIDYGDYDGCLVTKEYTPLAPGEVEHKFYCGLQQGGPGLALVKELKGKTKRVEYWGTEKPAGDYASDLPTSDSCSE